MSWKRLDEAISISDKFPKVAKTSPEALIVWTCVLPHSNRIGVYPNNPLLIKSQCMPLFPYELGQIADWLQVLIEARLIHTFVADDKEYLVFHDHADFNPPGVFTSKDSPFPDPPLDLCSCIEKSMKALRFPKGRPPKNRPGNGHNDDLQDENDNGHKGGGNGHKSEEEMATVSSRIVLSSSGGGVGGEDPSDPPGMMAILKATAFFKEPGVAAKKRSLQELYRLGVQMDSVLSRATTTEARMMTWYEFINWCKQSRKPPPVGAGAKATAPDKNQRPMITFPSGAGTDEQIREWRKKHGYPDPAAPSA